MREFWRVAIVISRNNRHQQKFISQTHGYFENQISLAVAIEWGLFKSHFTIETCSAFSCLLPTRIQ